MKTGCFIASLLTQASLKNKNSTTREFIPYERTEIAKLRTDICSTMRKNLCYLVFAHTGLLKEEYHITADSNKMLTSAYVGLHIQRCPRLFHLLRIIMNWGRRRQINGYHEKLFLTDEQLAIIFIKFCEKCGFLNEVNCCLG